MQIKILEKIVLEIKTYIQCNKKNYNYFFFKENCLEF